MTTTQSSDVPQTTLADLIEGYEVLLFDAYGVLVHSQGALPGAVELIQTLNRMAKPYYILTNDASKLPATAAAFFQQHGLALTPDRIITSGSLLLRYFAAHRLRGARCVVLGPEDSVQYVREAGGRIVPPAETFDVLVIADEYGFPFLETVDKLITSLFRELDHRREVHLVLPNPDLIYPRTDHDFGFGAGSIASMFEGALRMRYPQRTDLQFARLGKPGEALFAEARTRSGTRNMVMIGDQLETDIRGARAFGLDAVLIETGVTREAFATLPVRLRPTYRLGSLHSGLEKN